MLRTLIVGVEMPEHHPSPGAEILGESTGFLDYGSVTVCIGLQLYGCVNWYLCICAYTWVLGSV